VALGLLLAVVPAHADILHLKDGRKLEGKILEETSTQVKIRLRFGGPMTVSRREIERIEKVKLPEDIIAEKLAALDPADADAHWQLAQEAKKKRLRKQFKSLREKVLSIDPEHEGANLDLGRVRHDGRWMTPEERDGLLASAEEAEKAAQGLVKYQGRWVSKEEKDALERGLVKHDGRWMSLKEAKEAQGFVRYKKGWVKKSELEGIALRDSLVEAAGVPLTVATTERFIVMTVYPKKDTEQFARDCQKAYAEFSGIFGVSAKERLFDDPFTSGPRERRCHIVILEKDLQYQKFLDGLLRWHKELNKVLHPKRVGLMRKQKGFYLVDPDCWVVGYQFPYPKKTMRHTVVHKLSHVMLMRWHFKGMAWPGWWLVEGLGQMQEINAFGRCDTYCVTTGYGQKDPGEKWVGESWKATCKRMVTSGGDRRLSDVMLKALNELEPYDLVKCWSLVHYLVALDKQKFVRLVRLMKDGTKAHDAIPRVYDSSVEELDKRWRDFVKRTY
jgi:hypothetical protein